MEEMMVENAQNSEGVSSEIPEAAAPVAPAAKRPEKLLALMVLATAGVVLISGALGFIAGRVGTNSGLRSGSRISTVPGTFNPFPSFNFPGNSGTQAKVPAADAKLAKRVDKGLVDISTSSSYQSGAEAGTGMVIAKDGLILTNNHVIAGATSITVRDIATGHTYTAVVLGYDLKRDVALLKVQGNVHLATVKLGVASKLSTGEKVVGIGNAGGVGGTPSVAPGKITDLNQSVTVGGGPTGSESLKGLIKSNAGIEPGDSGGPLVNTKGQVIGMDTAAQTGTVVINGKEAAPQAFSIPVDTALRIASAIKKGVPAKNIHIGATAFLGVEIEAPSSFYVYNGSVPAKVPGATLAEVLGGTPAASSGLAAGDVITSIDNEPVSSSAQLTTIISGLAPGDSVPVGYVTPSGTHDTVTVTLGTGPAQ